MPMWSTGWGTTIFASPRPSSQRSTPTAVKKKHVRKTPKNGAGGFCLFGCIFWSWAQFVAEEVLEAGADLQVWHRSPGLVQGTGTMAAFVQQPFLWIVLSMGQAFGFYLRPNMQAVTSHALGSSSMSRTAVATWLHSPLLQLAPYTMMCLKPSL